MEISDILDAVRNGAQATSQDVVKLLSAEGREMEELFAEAREVRDRQFGFRLRVRVFLHLLS